MSAPKDPSHKSDQKQLETQQDDDLGLEEPNSKDDQGKDFPKMGQTAKTAISPLTLIKEEVKKMFKDKDTDPKPSQSAEKITSPLSLLKEDFNSLKQEFSNVFRIGLSRDPENKNVAEKDDSRNNPRMKVSRADEPFNSLVRQEKPCQKTAQTNHTEEAKRSQAELEISSIKQTRETEKTEKSNNTKYGLNKSEVSQLPACCSEEETEKTKTLAPTQSETMFASKTATALQNEETKNCRHGSPDAPEEEEDKPLEKALSTEISLFPVRTNLSNQPTEDLWSLKNSAIYLTFDPNTANSELRLTNDNRKATRDWLKLRSVHHLEQFEQCPQVLCREGLLDLAYWEVLWTGGVDIGVTDNSISRDTVSCLLGHNERSWSLECSNGFYTPCHNNRRFQSSSPEPFSNRVGVYLNCSAGTLSFFCISQDAMVHLHTFTFTFREPLYPCFWVWANNGSVTLCQVELDWERLL
ncbi:hypothetical protein CHARACLAT_003500 [Characodon lateralis]|uniref:B30.2/SPRY domain-containing protein n=1 Tax=Characodon lateralis TaxID=208331 RepID=A0ABU7DXD8_9TELE|nr:hypothetical protein [Characodon lateralis]